MVVDELYADYVRRFLRDLDLLGRIIALATAARSNAHTQREVAIFTTRLSCSGMFIRNDATNSSPKVVVPDNTTLCQPGLAVSGAVISFENLLEEETVNASRSSGSEYIQMECVFEVWSPETSIENVRLSFKNTRPCWSMFRSAPLVSRAIRENRASPMASVTESPLTVGVVTDRCPLSNTTISSSSKLFMTSEVTGACASRAMLRGEGVVVVVDVVVEVVDVVDGAVDVVDDV